MLGNGAIRSVQQIVQGVVVRKCPGFTARTRIVVTWQSPRAPYFGNDFERRSRSENGGLGDMVGYARRRVPRERPSKDQRKFLEVLRDLGPQDNAQTAAIRKSTKRACQVRGWVEWRCIDQCPGMRAWHLTVIGRKALNSLMRKPSLPAKRELGFALLKSKRAARSDPSGPDHC